MPSEGYKTPLLQAGDYIHWKPVAARGHMNRRASEQRESMLALLSEKEEKAIALTSGRGPKRLQVLAKAERVG